MVDACPGFSSETCHLTNLRALAPWELFRWNFSAQSCLQNCCFICYHLRCGTSKGRNEAMARIWRAAFRANNEVLDLVIVEADEVEAGRVSKWPSLAQQVLAMNNCNCEKHWPFECSLGMEDLLKQLGNHGWGVGHSTYVSCTCERKELHALGLGSDSF